MAELKQKNVYQKLQEARVILQEKNLKKSGRNKLIGYNYYELSDFLPTVNVIFNELGLFSAITFDEKQAVLTIYNTEKPEETITFASPNADALLKDCHPMQNIGAVETYQRRYLYMVAFEIVEADILDATVNTNISNKKKELERKNNIEKAFETTKVQENKEILEQIQAEVPEKEIEKTVESEKIEISLEQLRAELSEVREKGGKELIKELLEYVGANKLSDVKKEDYGKLMKKIKEVK